MTASKPDLRVRAVGAADVRSWLEGFVVGTRRAGDGSTLALVEMQDDAAAGFPVGREFDFCAPGFRVEVMRELLAAEVPLSGASGIAMLRQREHAARSKANRFAAALVDIGKVLVDTAKDAARVSGPSNQVHANRLLVTLAGLDAVGRLVESCADELCGRDPAKTARDVLAAHGWTEVQLEDASAWTLDSDDNNEPTVVLHRGKVAWCLDHDFSAAECRAFATLAEESRP